MHPFYFRVVPRANHQALRKQDKPDAAEAAYQKSEAIAAELYKELPVDLGGVDVRL